MELCEFRRNVEQIAEYWFAPHEEKMELTDGAQELANGMLGSAVYGTWNEMEENLLEEHRPEQGSAQQAGLRYLWHCIFLPRKNMEGMYPICGGIRRCFQPAGCCEAGVWYLPLRGAP